MCDHARPPTGLCHGTVDGRTGSIGPGMQLASDGRAGQTDIDRCAGLPEMPDALARDAEQTCSLAVAEPKAVQPMFEFSRRHRSHPTVMPPAISRTINCCSQGTLIRRSGRRLEVARRPISAAGVAHRFSRNSRSGRLDVPLMSGQTQRRACNRTSNTFLDDLCDDPKGSTHPPDACGARRGRDRRLGERSLSLLRSAGLRRSFRQALCRRRRGVGLLDGLLRLLVFATSLAHGDGPRCGSDEDATKFCGTRAQFA